MHRAPPEPQPPPRQQFGWRGITQPQPEDTDMSNGLMHAHLHERDCRVKLDAARAATNIGAPMYIEAKAEAQWRAAYCRVMELSTADARSHALEGDITQ